MHNRHNLEWNSIYSVVECERSLIFNKLRISEVDLKCRKFPAEAFIINPELSHSTTGMTKRGANWEIALQIGRVSTNIFITLRDSCRILIPIRWHVYLTKAEVSTKYNGSFLLNTIWTISSNNVSRMTALICLTQGNTVRPNKRIIFIVHVFHWIWFYQSKDHNLGTHSEKQFSFNTHWRWE